MTTSELIHEFVYSYSMTEDVSGKTGNVSYHRNTLYSYAAPILRRTPKDNAWLVDNERFSSTTSKHQSYARSAAFGKLVYCRISRSNKVNIKIMCDDIKTALIKINRARGAKATRVQEFCAIMANMREYLAIMRCKSLVPKDYRELIAEGNTDERRDELSTALLTKLLKKDERIQLAYDKEAKASTKRREKAQKKDAILFDKYEIRSSRMVKYDRIRYNLKDPSLIETTQEVKCSAQLCRKFLSRVIARDYEFVKKHTLDHRYHVTILDDPTEVKVGCHRFKIKHLSDVLYEYSNKIRGEEKSI